MTESPDARPPGVDLLILEEKAKSYLRAAENRDELTPRQIRANVAKLMGIDQAALELPAVKLHVKKVIEQAFLNVQDEIARDDRVLTKQKRGRDSGSDDSSTKKYKAKPKLKAKATKRSCSEGDEEVADSVSDQEEIIRKPGGKNVVVESSDRDSDLDFANPPTSASRQTPGGGGTSRLSGKKARVKPARRAKRQGNENAPEEGDDGDSSDFMTPPQSLPRSATKATKKRTQGVRKSAGKQLERAESAAGSESNGDGKGGATPRKEGRDSTAPGATTGTRKPKGSAESSTKSKRAKSKTANMPPAVPGKELDLTAAEAEKINSLKKFITACGVRKKWGKELGDLDTGSAIIGRLKTMLRDLGVEGRPSLGQCQRLKQQRELQAEINAMDTNNIIENVEEAKLSRRAKASSWLYPAGKTKEEERMIPSCSDNEDDGP